MLEFLKDLLMLAGSLLGGLALIEVGAILGFRPVSRGAYLCEIAAKWLTTRLLERRRGEEPVKSAEELAA